MADNFQIYSEKQRASKIKKEKKKLEEIFKNVDEVEANFTCSNAYLDYFISHQEEVDKAHKEKLKNFKIVDGVPEVECPNCRALSPLTVTKCPNCGMQFENGE